MSGSPANRRRLALISPAIRPPIYRPIFKRFFTPISPVIRLRRQSEITLYSVISPLFRRRTTRVFALKIRPWAVRLYFADELPLFRRPITGDFDQKAS